LRSARKAQDDDSKENHRTSTNGNEAPKTIGGAGAEAEANAAVARQRAAVLEGESRPRVLAYSDSDSDVESHIQHVKDHILPKLESLAPPPAEEETVSAESSTEVAEDLALSNTATENSLDVTASTAITAALKHLTPMVVVKIAGLLYARSLSPTLGDGLEATAAVAGAAGIVMRRRSRQRIEAGGRAQGSAGLGASTTPPSQVEIQAIEFGAAAAVLLAGRAALRMYRGRRSGAVGRLLRLTSPVNINALRERERPAPQKPPECAAEWAVVYRPEMLEMRRMLRECGVELPSPRFDDTDAELMRFAVACGLRRAEEDAPARAAAIERAVRRVILACEWISSATTMPETKLRRWERLVAWRGADVAGCPILLVRLGRALQLCTKQGRLEAFTQAIASQIALGLVSRTSNEPGKPDQFVAVIDCRETSNWDALIRSREVYALANGLVGDLAQHYPERLKKVYLLELPIVARMHLNSVIAGLPDSTKEKIVHAYSTDDCLPITLANLQRRRSCAAGLGRVGSETSFATTECSTPGREEEDELQEKKTENELEERQQHEHMIHDTVDREVRSVEDLAGAGPSQPFEPATAVSAPAAAQQTDDSINAIDAAEVGNEVEKGVAASLQTLQDSDGRRQTTPATSRGTEGTEVTATSTESLPARGAVAANLLGAMDRVAAQVPKFSSGKQQQSPDISSDASRKQPLAGSLSSTQSSKTIAMRREDEIPGSMIGALSSHRLPDSPSLLSPVTSLSPTDGVLLAGTSHAPGASSHVPSRNRTGLKMASPSSASSVSMWKGLAALLTNMLPKQGRRRSGNELTSPRGRSRMVATNSNNVRAYHIHPPPSLLSSENSLCSIPETPPSSAMAGATTTPTTLLHPKGGLRSLPPRVRASNGRKTPAKSSLRRSRSQEPPHRTGMPLVSFPLRRQTSVSWAENLERVREIEASPVPSPVPSTMRSQASETGASGGSPLGGSAVSIEELLRELGDVVETKREDAAESLERVSSGGSASGDWEIVPNTFGGEQRLASAVVRQDVAFQLMLLLMLCVQLLSKVFLGV
jgi:hypothetical protein